MLAALLRFLGRRLQSGLLARHPLVRRFFMLVALIGWVRRRFPEASQRITLRKGERLRVEVIPAGKDAP